MTDIICRWLNEDVQLSSSIEKEHVSKLFSSGYLFGEILFKYGLQDDFSSFSKGRTTDSKLNNFTRLESVMKLLEIPYDTNVAKSIMNENHGAATKVLYQLFIALGRKAKKNLTGIAMETMRPSAPVKLENIERGIHKERLKQLVPRQVDVNFETLVEKYQSRQKLQEEMAIKARQEEEMRVKKYQQDVRQRGLEKSRLARDKQNEEMQKIREAQIRIPKPPESKKSARTKQEIRKEIEIQEVKDHISSFEEILKTSLPSQSSAQFDSEIEGRQDSLESRSLRKPLQPIALKTAGDDYVSKIKKRLNEDATARKEREKRRRRVLIEQLKAHEAQEEQRREEMLVKRLMRQSQQEKRIAVQLMQIRHEKQVIKENRIFREKQYTERRFKDFEDALNREAEMCRLAQIEYRDQIKKAEEERRELLEERRKAKYEKHYKICQQILSDIVDFSCKIGEYRELTEGNVPEKLFREWKGYFDTALPLYPEEILTEEEIKKSKEFLVEEEKNKLTDESDFVEYRAAVGEWQASEDSAVDVNAQIPPKDNPILGHIIQKLFNIISPPEPPPPTPEFPPFPIKACFLGKFFSGKTTAVERLIQSHRVVRLCIDDLVQEAIEAHKIGETKDDMVENIEARQSAEVSGENQAAGEAEKISDQACDETKENQDPNNATAPHAVESSSNSEKTENNKLPDETKSFQVIQKPTSRSVLGEKAYEYLKKGKLIPDQLLVDIGVDAIRQVPAGTGWILDGFPSTLHQAKLLEKSLTGYDASKEVKTKETKGRGKKSRIAPDPRPPLESPPPKSGVDIVVLFDVSDDVVLRRAEGRTYNPANSEVFHQEFSPPVDGSYTGLGKQEKVLPVTDPSNDREQVQQRITGFDDSWSKLEKWFNKFGVLTKVGVDNTIDEVYECVTSLLVETTQRLHGPPKEEKVEEAAVVLEDKEATDASAVSPAVDDDNTAVDEVTDATTHEDVEATKQTLDPKPVSPKSSRKMSKKDRSPSPGSKRDAVSPKGSKKNLGSKKGSPSPSRKASRVKSSSGSRTEMKRVKSPVKSKQEVPEELPPEPVVPPGPEPGSKEWEYVDQPIELPLVEVLVTRWENLEKTYIDTSKNVFREIRLERESICRYFYGTRKEFLAFLRRPDEKEEYVLQWQNHYNDVAEDMRGDDEVKAELDQEVDDLCDRLYEICDNRKEMAENERTIVMEEGWLQDRLGLLTNHYLTLMQVEVDRYQDTYRVLKDYYNSAQGKNPIEAYSEICRVPLVELPPVIPTIPSSVGEAGSQHEVKQTSSKKDRETVKTPEVPTSEGEEHRSRIPLVPRRPKSGDLASTREKKDKKSSKDKRDKGDNQSETPVLPSDPDERLVFDGYYHATGIIDTLASLDQVELEEEANKMAEVLKEKEKEKEKDVGKKGGGKDKKVDKKGKKSATKATATKPESPPPVLPSEGENEEEKLKKELKEKARKEFLGAVLFEDIALRTRLEMIRNHSVAVLQELKSKAESTYKDMDEWLGARFLQEVDSIRAMAGLARTAIENEQKLQQQLILEDKNFVVYWDVNVFRTPSPTPPPSPKERTSRDHFTAVQLQHLYNEFCQAAPSGLISCRAFVDIFLDLMTTSFGMEMLPDSWISQTGLQLHSLTTVISHDSEFVDWKRFLVLASTPLPMPTRVEIIDTLSKFMNVDVEKTGSVSEQQFLELQLWFSEECGNEDGDIQCEYPRIKHLKQLLFKIFCDSKKTPPLLNYEEFLLYFAMDENPVEGILRALSIVCGQSMPSSSIFQTETTEGHEDTATGASQAVTKNIAEEPGAKALITLRDLIKVFHHGGNEFSDKQRFHGAEYLIKPFSKERLSGVFMELGASEEESLPFYLLYHHPIIEDCIQICQRFKYYNLKNLLTCQKSDASINEGGH